MKLFATIVSIFLIFMAATISGHQSLPVYGHANPASYIPKPNQKFTTVQSIPDKLSIVFTQLPEVKASNIKVVDQNGFRVDKKDLSISEADNKLSVSLDKSRMKDGIYTANWLALSKEDGHVTKGSYVFTVQTANANTNTQTINATNHPTLKQFSFIKDNANLTLSISPFKTGHNTFNFTINDMSGNPITNIKNVYLTLNNPGKSIGPISETMEKISDGKFGLDGDFLSQNGEWNIKIVVQRIGQYDINQEVKMEIK